MDLAERYAYYGFRAILFLYFDSFGFLSDTTARLMFHLYSIVNFLSPIPGAWLADDKFGRYSVIFAFLIIYLAGLGILTVASALTVAGQVTQFILSLVGLGLVAVGSGAIKPTASSLGADQLRTPLQHLLLPFFFSLWYYATNIGSIAAQLLTPALRDAFGYPYAFLSAFVLLFIALAVFLLGRKRYYRAPPSSTPLISDLSKVFLSSVRNRFRRTPRQPSGLSDISLPPVTGDGPGSSDHGMGGSMIGHSSRGALSAHVAPEAISRPISEVSATGEASEAVSGVVGGAVGGAGFGHSLPPHLEPGLYTSDGAMDILSHPDFHQHTNPHTHSVYPELPQEPRSYTTEARPGPPGPIPPQPHLQSPLDFPVPSKGPHLKNQPFTTPLGHHSLPQLDPCDHNAVAEVGGYVSGHTIHAGAESEPVLTHPADGFGVPATGGERGHLGPSRGMVTRLPFLPPFETTPDNPRFPQSGTMSPSLIPGHAPTSPSQQDRSGLTGRDYVKLANQRRKIFAFVDAALVDTPRHRVNELRAFLASLVILFPIIFFFILYDQGPTLLVIQARSMDRNLFGYDIAPETFQALNPLFLLVLIPIYENFMLPFVHKHHIPFPPLWRIWLGFLTIASAFVLGGIVELQIRPGGPPVSYAWQIPFWFLTSVSEIFVMITGFDLAYSQTPPRIKSVMTAIFWFTESLGNMIISVLLATGLLSVVSLAVNFFFSATIIFVVTVIHIPLMSRYRYIDKAHGDNSITWLFDPIGADRGAPPSVSVSVSDTEPTPEPTSELGHSHSTDRPPTLDPAIPLS